MSSFIISAVLLMIAPTIAVAADPFHHHYGWEHPRLDPGSLDPGSNDPYDTSNNNKEQNQIAPVEITEENSKIQNLIGSSMAIGGLPTDSKYSVDVRPWEDPMPHPGGPHPTSESNEPNQATHQKAQEVQFFHPDYYPHPSLLK